MLPFLLLFHTIAELIFGVWFLVSPETIPVSFLHNLSPVGKYLAKMYAFAALAMAVLGYQIWHYYPERHILLVGLLVLATFHTGITLAQIFNPFNSSEPYAAGVLHGVLAFAFWVYYFKEW